ncbi:hypothetical protein GCM10027052_02770 [Parafrigoribacterium mesophilum]|uniref:hypothetical protein n=1 Tax=Parafrigoribacterium mesophilum TaxID=433646 RepID=UPI0031FD64C6
MRQIDAGSTVGVVVGLRVAIGAGLLAVGWLVLGGVTGGASAAELDVADGSLLGPDSGLAVVTESLQGVGTDAGPRVATPGADHAPAVAGLPALASIVTDAAAVQQLTEPVSESVEPVLESVEPVLKNVEPVLNVLDPVLQSVEPVLKTVGVDATVFGTQPESIEVAPERATAAYCVTDCDARATEVPPSVRGDIRSTRNRSAAAIAPEDPVPHAPAPSAPLAPMVLSETVTPGTSGSIALASDVAERGWVFWAPSARTMPPGEDVPPASPTYESNSTPD